MVEWVDYESEQQAAERFNDSPDLSRNVSPDALPASYRVKLKDPTKVAQIHNLFCSGRFNDRGREICNPGVFPRQIALHVVIGENPTPATWAVSTPRHCWPTVMTATSPRQPRRRPVRGA